MHTRAITNDWNDLRLIWCIAHSGSFLKASAILQVDQSTVGRRVALLEERAGVPLFHRRPNGAVITESGRTLLSSAEAAAAAAESFHVTLESMMDNKSAITIAAPEGIATYFLGPRLSELSSEMTVAGSRRRRTTVIPPARFGAVGSLSEIEIIMLGHGQEIPRSAEYRATKLGVMSFALVVGRRYMEKGAKLDGLKDLKSATLINHEVYNTHPSFRQWRDIIEDSGRVPSVSAPSSSALHQATIFGSGITLLPNFSPEIDSNVLIAPFATSDRIDVDLWAISHKEYLKLNSVRTMFDVVVDLFRRSPWF